MNRAIHTIFIALGIIYASALVPMTNALSYNAPTDMSQCPSNGAGLPNGNCTPTCGGPGHGNAGACQYCTAGNTTVSQIPYCNCETNTCSNCSASYSLYPAGPIGNTIQATNPYHGSSILTNNGIAPLGACNGGSGVCCNPGPLSTSCSQYTQCCTENASCLINNGLCTTSNAGTGNCGQACTVGSCGADRPCTTSCYCPNAHHCNNTCCNGSETECNTNTGNCCAPNCSWLSCSTSSYADSCGVANQCGATCTGANVTCSGGACVCAYSAACNNGCCNSAQTECDIWGNNCCQPTTCSPSSCGTSNGTDNCGHACNWATNTPCTCSANCAVLNGACTDYYEATCIDNTGFNCTGSPIRVTEVDTNDQRTKWCFPSNVSSVTGDTGNGSNSPGTWHNPTFTVTGTSCSVSSIGCRTACGGSGPAESCSNGVTCNGSPCCGSCVHTSTGAVCS